MPRKPAPDADPKFTIISLSSLEREEWDAFIELHSPGNLLQSYAWGDFKHLMGDQVLRYGILHQQELVGVAQIIVHARLLGGATAYLSRGPVMAGQTPKLMMYFLEHLSRICQTAQTTDLIVEPLLTGIATSSWQQLKFYPTTSVQPRFTSQVDLTVPDLMESFKPKTRYNIRLAEKKEVAISASTERTDLIEFYRLLTVTARRQNVTFYPMDYYQTLFDAFSPAGNITVMTARQGNDVLAALLLIFYQDTAYYLYGGTADLKREYMANYLLHYRAMELARDAGSAFYDFWGIAMADDPLAEKWAGITRFKLGFSGTMIEYAPAFRRIFRSFWPRLRALFNSLRSLPSLLKRRPA